MATKKRKKTVSKAEQERRKAASQAAFYRANPKEHFADAQREHYTREFARLNSPHTPEAIGALVGPMEKALQAIEATGDGLVDREGDYVFFPHGEEECFPLPDGIFALCKTLLLVSHDERRVGLMRVAHKLQAHMPLFASDMEGAWSGFAWAREELADLTPTEFLNLTKQAEDLEG